MKGYVICIMGENKNAYMVLVRKPEGKRPLGRPRPKILEGQDGMVWTG
jgi:hypothetical protein